MIESFTAIFATLFTVLGIIAYFVINAIIAGMTISERQNINPGSKSWPTLLWAIPVGLPVVMIVVAGLAIWWLIKLVWYFMVPPIKENQNVE